MTTTTREGQSVAPRTIVDVRTDQRNRLSAAARASADELKKVQEKVAAGQTALTAATAAVAAEDLTASRLRQDLAAAVTGPERHRIELLLDAAAVRRLRAVRTKVAVGDAVALGQAAITRLSASAGALAARLTAAEAALTAAVSDAEAEPTHDAVLAALTAVGESRALFDQRLGAAHDVLDSLLGGAGARTKLADHVTEVLRADNDRRAAITHAEDAVLATDVERSPVDGALATAARQHARARTTIGNAILAPPLAATALAAVDAVIALPGLDAMDQEAITRAATQDDDAAHIPMGTDVAATRLENWAITVPAAVLAPALALIRAEFVMGTLKDLDADTLTEALVAARNEHAEALEKQLVVIQEHEAAQLAVDALVAEATILDGTSAERLSLAVSGSLT